jgi:hypothetical protein
MWNSWTGISDETLAEAEAIVERANGEKILVGEVCEKQKRIEEKKGAHHERKTF